MRDLISYFALQSLHHSYYLLPVEDQPEFSAEDPCIGAGWQVEGNELYWVWKYPSGNDRKTWCVEFLLIQIWQPQMSQAELQERIVNTVTFLYNHYGLPMLEKDLLVEECEKMQIQI